MKSPSNTHFLYRPLTKKDVHSRVMHEFFIVIYGPKETKYNIYNTNKSVSNCDCYMSDFMVGSSIFLNSLPYNYFLLLQSSVSTQLLELL